MFLSALKCLRYSSFCNVLTAQRTNANTVVALHHPRQQSRVQILSSPASGQCIQYSSTVPHCLGIFRDHQPNQSCLTEREINDVAQLPRPHIQQADGSDSVQQIQATDLTCVRKLMGPAIDSCPGADSFESKPGWLEPDRYNVVLQPGETKAKMPIKGINDLNGQAMHVMECFIVETLSNLMHTLFRYFQWILLGCRMGPPDRLIPTALSELALAQFEFLALIHLQRTMAVLWRTTWKRDSILPHSAAVDEPST
jgi:hypothetical protein